MITIIRETNNIILLFLIIICTIKDFEIVNNSDFEGNAVKMFIIRIEWTPIISMLLFLSILLYELSLFYHANGFPM